MYGFLKSALISAAMLTAQTAAAPEMDPENPTCPAEPNWSDNKKMELTLREVEGDIILFAEGAVDSELPKRLEKKLTENPGIKEIWLRSPGGNARAGNEAGLIIRKTSSVITRIPPGWTCFSACNFVFMGGNIRMIDEGGHFMVHMFTMTGERDAIDYSVAMGTDSTVELIGAIEQESALLATEDNDFLIRMGVSRKLLTEVMYLQQAVKTEDNNSTRRCLTQEEAFKYNVANVAD